MAELTPSERLQPSLLDRLTDDDPESRVESRDKRVMSLSRIRESVLRDLGWLLNCGNFEQVTDLEPFPAVKSSVLNYGMPDIAGQTASGIKTADLERRVRDAIWSYEPRILRHTLRVTAVVAREKMSANTLMFDIQGEMWAQPLPIRLYLRTELDLETGQVIVADQPGH